MCLYNPIPFLERGGSGVIGGLREGEVGGCWTEAGGSFFTT